MKLLNHVGIGVLSLVLGVPAFVFAQDAPKPDEPRPEPKAQDEAKPPKAEQPKPESKQDEMKPPKESKTDRQETDRQEEAKPEPGRQEQANPKGAKPATQSVHIPDKKFHANFGRSHTVVIRQPVIVEGQPRFQYGGYWFIISDPWPGDWAYTDDCYIDYVDGGYFLFDLLHPGIRIALIVVE